MNPEDIVVNNRLTTEKFISEIDDLVLKYNLEYLDAVVYYCEKNNLELETAESIIKSNLKIKSKLQLEAENLNFLPKTAKLNFD